MNSLLRGLRPAQIQLRATARIAYALGGLMP